MNNFVPDMMDSHITVSDQHSNIEGTRDSGDAPPIKHIIGSNILVNESTMREKKAGHRQHSKIVMRNGDKYRKVEKKVYYNGTAFTMEEEERVDSDEASSVITSEDEFQVDDQVIM